MAEKAFDTREFGEALNAADADADSATTKAGPSSTSTSPPKPLTIDDLPKELIVSIFMAVGDLTWVRHTFPLVCKAWNEIYCSQDASPLHETLEVDFEKEVKGAWQEWALEVDFRGEVEKAWQQWLRGLIPIACDAQGLAPCRAVVHASSIISWAERRAASVRKLCLLGGFEGALEDFSAEDLSELLAVVGSSLTHISIDSEQLRSSFLYELLRKPFWESLRDSVVPAGQLRSLVVKDIFFRLLESDVEPLVQLAGSLEELVLDSPRPCSPHCPGLWEGFPEFICSLTKLRRLALVTQTQITAIPADISSLQELEDLDLHSCDIFSLPKELGELSGLTRLDLSYNGKLGCPWSSRPAGETIFPAELGKLKSLRELFLSFCDLRAVPAVIGELESLEVLCLSYNDHLQIHAPLDFLIEGCPMLCEVRLQKKNGWAPWTPESLTHLKAFKAKLLAKNPSANVLYL